MRILVLGTAGMLGFALHRILTDTGWHVVGTVRSKNPPKSVWCVGLDYLTQVYAEDIKTVEKAIELSQASVVINAVGSKVARSSDEINNMLVVNSLFPRRLGLLTAKLGVRLIHFSSDGVFKGQNSAPYDETYIPDADDIYGMSKYLGEPYGDHILTLRTSLIGRSLNTSEGLVDWLLSQTGRVKGYRRAIFTGLPVNEIGNILSKYILPKLESLRGLFNLSSKSISKADLLRLICDTWSLDRVYVEPDDSVVIDRSLDSRLLMSLIGYNMPLWPQLIASMYQFYADLEKKGRHA